ncbi:MAG: hypothetical protein M3Y54_22445, partial [Bacteroidota bacterium]|nr:hypothetical protein [Bacteroidota bacterium]
MNLFRLLGLGALLALAGTGISSCLSPPNFPVVPNIDFKDIHVLRVPNADGGKTEIDTVFISINFQDGDGDLGLDSKDADVPPYNGKTGGINNATVDKNIIVQVYKKNALGHFDKFITPLISVVSYYGRYPRLDGSIDGKSVPLKGTLTYKLPSLSIDNQSYFPGDVLRFEVSILDRAFHQSNVITTTEVT